MREHYDDDVNAHNYWPKTALPPRELVARTRRLLARGEPKESIARRTGLTSNRVLAISRLSERYDPVDDEVAVQRALDGDRSVLASLSFYERETIMDCLVARFESEPFDGSVHDQHWLTPLMKDWGIAEPTLFRSRVEKRARVLRRAAS